MIDHGLTEARFHDAVTHVLTAADRPGVPVEVAVAEAMRRMFLAAPVHVIWRARDQRLAASCPDLRAEGRSVEDPARIDEIAALAEPAGTVRGHPHVSVALVAEEAPGWGFSLMATRDGAWLQVIFEGSRPDGHRPLLEWVSQYAQGAHELYAAVQALVALQTVRRDAAYAGLARRAAALIGGTEHSFSRDLEEAVRLLAELDAPRLEARRLDLALDLAVWAAQAVLGVGGDGRLLPDGEGPLVAFCEALDRLAARARTSGVGRPQELACLAGILRATVEEEEPDAGATRPVVEPALQLLVTWTALHERAARIAARRRPARPEDDAAWNAHIEQALPDLARVLEQRALGMHADAATVRNQARLWFCQGLLLASAAGAWWKGVLLDDEKWRFRRDLAYVLRESVRYLVYGQRADWRFQPAAFAEALCTLVEEHALRVVGLAREYDLRTHLREIGEVRGPEGYHFASGHLQHVLEIYIGGHLLCATRLVADRDAGEAEKVLDGWTVAEALASRAGWRPGEHSTVEFLQAFSLAALFHDTGMLLYPRYARVTEAMRRGDPRLEAAFSAVEEAFREAGEGLVARCVEELRHAGVLDPSTEPVLAAWIEDQRQHGAPDHGLLGTWYLHRVSRGAGTMPAEVVREALRAVQLHSLHGVPVDADRDPVAALLLLCDELFEWEPLVRPGPAPFATGRSLGAIAADVRPRRSRARTLVFPGLSVHAGLDGRVELRLKLEAGAVEGGWPRANLRLHPPERLEAPVHFIWLSVAQNIGRIQRSRHGFGPVLTLHSTVPARLRANGVNTRWLLGQIALRSRHPARVSVERWLHLGGGEHFHAEEGSESVVVRAGDHVLHSEDIRRSFPALAEDADRVVQEFEGRGRR